MREILFRGKKKNGEWVEGFLFNSQLCRIFWATAFKKEEDNIFYCEGKDVIPETVGQFTGLTDKNGKKVFEGDIVKATICINDWSRDGVRNEEGIYEIKYHTEHCYFYLAKEGNNLLFDGNWRYFLKEIKVIGNKWDNPELLGE